MGHQHLDVGALIDERRPPLFAVGDQPERWHLGAGIDAGHVPGEPAGHGHPLRPQVAARRGVRQLRPGQSRVERDGRGADRVQVGDEPWQQTDRLGELVTERVAQPQVVLGPLGQGAHRDTTGPEIGQGPATARSATRSSLA